MRVFARRSARENAGRRAVETKIKACVCAKRSTRAEVACGAVASVRCEGGVMVLLARIQPVSDQNVPRKTFTFGLKVREILSANVAAIQTMSTETQRN